jgi:DNA processing protein
MTTSANISPNHDPYVIDLLRLTLTPGLGPVLIARLLEHFGDPSAALGSSASQLAAVQGIGPKKSDAIARALTDPQASVRVQQELELAARIGVRFVALSAAGAGSGGAGQYPSLLAEIPDPPPLLAVRGSLEPLSRDRYTIAIVGSRTCSHYGLEQADRFATALAQAGLCVVSGGARGIDTAAHRAALRVGGRTLVVMGCGLAECYPPDNSELFEQIVAGDHGALISELPLRTPPSSENFPSRNRIICGMSLGTIVIEGSKRSGSLITARTALEQGREVFALPGRVDSPTSEGPLELIKESAAALITHPDDVLASLQTAAEHLHRGTHAVRYAAPAPTSRTGATQAATTLFAETPASSPRTATTKPAPSPAQTPAQPEIRDAGLTDSQRGLVAALTEPMSLDELARRTGFSPAALRADLTILEIRKRVKRAGTLVARA